mmetsp:Transcript_46405/g.83645  ORF Transcript_46405/g.83645 Transcript_46405/m.83645 type:complete len:532 (-) Transcript_46405:354-1949(-)
MVHVDVNDDLHLPLMQKDNHRLDLVLCAVGRIHGVQVFRPIPVVAMRHLVHNGGEHNTIDAKLLKIANPVHEPLDSAAAVVVQLVAVLFVGTGEAVDQDLVHCHLRPCPGALRKAVPGLLRAVVRHVPHRAGQGPKALGLLEVGLVRVLEVGLVEELCVAVDARIAAIIATPMTLVDARLHAGIFSRLANARVDLHVKHLPDQNCVPLLIGITVGRKAHRHGRRLARPGAGVEHVIAWGLPAHVVQHAAPNTGIPLFVQELQLHPELRVLAVLSEERLLRHGEVVLLVTQNLDDMIQALVRRSYDHDTCIHETRVTITDRTNLRTALFENGPWTLRIKVENHVSIHKGHLRVLRHSPDCKLVHDAAPTFVDHRVVVHGRGHKDGLRVADLDPFLLQDMEVLHRSLAGQIFGDDGQNILDRASCPHRLHQHTGGDKVLGTTAVEEECKGLQGHVALIPFDAVVAGALAPAAFTPAARHSLAECVVAAGSRQRPSSSEANGRVRELVLGLALLVLGAVSWPLLCASPFDLPAF